MYNHSVLVKDLALKISDQVECDKTVVAIGALFHDIGKTHKADEETLRFDHEKFNLPISEKFIDASSLTEDKKFKLKEIISYTSDSVEAKIIKDADALALFADQKLYMLFIEWAVKNNFASAIQRKIDKFKKLRFPVSVEMGRKWFDQMMVDWNRYMEANTFRLSE